MNAVEIEAAISELALLPFDATEFSLACLAASGNKETALKRLRAGEVHFPATIADLYDPDTMPDNLRRAHARNDEVLERIYMGRRLKNDTERLEKLFELYTKMAAEPPTKKTGKGK